VATAMDGSPVIFFEDLFDIGGTGRRWCSFWIPLAARSPTRLAPAIWRSLEYETIKVHYPEGTNVSQKIWVKVNYTAPTSLKPVAPAFANLNWLANRQFQFTLDVGIGVRYFIQASSDLINWSAITTNAAPFDFADNAPGNSPIRFYRGVYFP